MACTSARQISIFATICLLSGQPTMVAAGSLRKVNMREVEIDLQASLSDLLDSTSPSAARRLAVIEASTWQTFQALPKNALGRLAPPAVRYVVHSYFAKEHGWLIKGLEPHGMQSTVTQVHNVNVLQDKVPLLVEQLLEVRQADRGLALNDVVTMVAVLEQLMFDESMTLLEAAYRLNGLPMEDNIDEAMLHRVLQSYLILFGQGSKADLFDADHLQLILSRPRADVEEFENDSVLNFKYAHRHQANPFKPRLYSFQVVAEIMEDLAQQYGKWQNGECRDMKAHLNELDPEASGRVPLSQFYAQQEGSSYHFTESVEYLRTIGALDESSRAGPQVLIANYVAGPSNCIATSSYYSVCCLSECDHVLSDLEDHVQAPAASPERLLTLVHKITDSQLPRGLPEKLHTIAAQHGGQVPLHGRLFAQWLHFAFPRECPYPSLLDNATALTASHWLEGQQSAVATAEEKQQHISAASHVAKELEIDEKWSDFEVLPVHDRPTSSPFQIGASAMRTAVQLAAICVALRSALGAWRTTAFARDGASKKDDGYILPFRV